MRTLPTRATGGRRAPCFAVALAILVATCTASPTASPERTASPGGSSAPASPWSSPSTTRPPISTPIPTPDTTPSSAADSTQPVPAWPVSGVSGAVVDLAGIVYGWTPTDAVAALDRRGRPLPGWPVTLRPRGVGGWLSPIGDAGVLVGVGDSEGSRFIVHRLTTAGNEAPGWPVEQRARYCPPPVERVDHDLVLVCALSGSSATATTLRPDGVAVTMSELPSGEVEEAAAALADDGTVYVLVVSADEAQGIQVFALGIDGHLREGFPVHLEGRWATITAVPGGRALAIAAVPPVRPPEGLCGETERSVLTVLTSDARVAPGWPVTEAGWASTPEVAPDGTAFYLTRDRVFARDARGAVLPGWPVPISPVPGDCGHPGPILASGGDLLVIADVLHSFGRDGREHVGWPYRPPSGFVGLGCTMDATWTTPPAAGSDTVYVAVSRPGKSSGATPIDIVALDRTGRVLDGWPYALPVPDRGEIATLTVRQSDLYVGVQRCGAGASGPVLLALRPDATLVR